MQLFAQTIEHKIIKGGWVKGRTARSIFYVALTIPEVDVP